MLTINLLPQTARHPAPSAIEQFYRTPLFWLVIAGMGLVTLVSLGSLVLSNQQLRQLNAKIQALQPKKDEVDRLQESLQRLRAQEAAFQRIRSGEGLWSKRLEVLSRVTPDGVWFTDLSLDDTKGLVIQGSAISQGGAEMVSVGRLVSELKASPDFSSAVKEIQIESIKRVQEKELELVQFTLTCSLTEAPAS